MDGWGWSDGDWEEVAAKGGWRERGGTGGSDWWVRMGKEAAQCFSLVFDPRPITPPVKNAYGVEGGWVGWWWWVGGWRGVRTGVPHYMFS